VRRQPIKGGARASTPYKLLMGGGGYGARSPLHPTYPWLNR